MPTAVREQKLQRVRTFREDFARAQKGSMVAVAPADTVPPPAPVKAVVTEKQKSPTIIPTRPTQRVTHTVPEEVETHPPAPPVPTPPPVSSTQSPVIPVHVPVSQQAPEIVETPVVKVRPLGNAPRLSAAAIAADLSKIRTDKKRSVLASEESIFAVQTNESVQEGSIVTDTKRKRFRLLPAVGRALKGWFYETQKDFKQSRKPKHLVAPAETRKDVVTRAAASSAIAPKDDHTNVVRRLRHVPRVHTVKDVAIKKAVPPPKPTWTFTTDGTEDPVMRERAHDAIAELEAQANADPEEAATPKKTAREEKEITPPFTHAAPAKIEAPRAAAPVTKQASPIISAPPKTTEKSPVTSAPVAATMAQPKWGLFKKAVSQIAPTVRTPVSVPVVPEPKKPAPLPLPKPIVNDVPKPPVVAPAKVSVPVQSPVRPSEPVLPKPQPTAQRSTPSPVPVVPKTSVQQARVVLKPVSRPATPVSAATVSPVLQAREAGVIPPPVAPLRVIPITPPSQPKPIAVAKPVSEPTIVRTPAPTPVVPPAPPTRVLPTPEPERIVPPAPARPVVAPPEFTPLPENIAPLPSDVPQPRATLSNVRRPRFSFPIIAASIFAVVLGMSAAFAFFNLRGDDAIVPVTQSDEGLFSADASVPVAIGASRSELLSNLRIASDASTKNTIAELYPTVSTGADVRRATPTETLSLLSFRAPGGFLRSVTDIGFGAYRGSEPFIILKVNSFENALGGMVLWEKTMSADLAPLFGEPVTSTFDVRARTATGEREPFFVDEIYENRDIRVLRDGSEDERIVYSFLDRSTILITTDRSVIETIGPLVR